MSLQKASISVLIVWIASVGCSAEQSTTSQDRNDSASTEASRRAEDSSVPPDTFLVLLNKNPIVSKSSLSSIQDSWHMGYAAMLLEIHRFIGDRETGNQIAAVLQAKLGQSSESNRRESWRIVWQQPYMPHPKYAEFKAALYSEVDPRFAEYFRNTEHSTIRLDEVVWGGVVRDGIPPLKDPHMLNAVDADYLADTDVVFGIVVGDDARAYPKRILAWHEMVKDIVGGVSLNGVYCTLCGSMIAYKTEVNGKHYELGTSGFLYRSNKLMYDHETKSLWSTLDGKPCVGPLVGQVIELEPYHVVTTTWGEWKRRHPQTKVLSLKTGHRRDYGEGVAYRNYFATDDLMFDVPSRDNRLKNKDEVLIVRLDTERPIAISTKFLQAQPVYHDTVNQQRFVVVTDLSGANRVYAAGNVTFMNNKEYALIDNAGQTWTMTEASLINTSTHTTLARLPAHRAFWFGWYAVHPDTRLIQ